MDTPLMMIKGQFNNTRYLVSDSEILYFHSVLRFIREDDPTFINKFSVINLTTIKATDRVISDIGKMNTTHPIRNFRIASTVRIIKVFFCSKSAMFRHFMALIILSKMILMPTSTESIRIK